MNTNVSRYSRKRMIVRDLRKSIFRTRLEALIKPFVQKCLKSVEDVIASAGFAMSDMQEVSCCR
jgi:molecular chaperone DnaK (HSP70)